MGCLFLCGSAPSLFQSFVTREKMQSQKKKIFYHNDDYGDDYDDYDNYSDDYDDYDDKPPWGWAPVALRCKSPPTLKVEPA